MLVLQLFGQVHRASAQESAGLSLVGEDRAGTIIVQGREEGDDADPLFQAVWRTVPGATATFQWQPSARVPSGTHLMLDRLMEAAIGAYLDTRVHFTRNGVQADLPAERMVGDIDAMVKAAAKEFGVEALAVALSEPTRRQLDRLTRIDWSQARFGVDGGAEQDKYLAIYYYVRSQREELERQLRADLLPLASVEVLRGESADPGTTVRINSTCGTVFDEQNFLCALDLQLADTGNGGVDPVLGQQLMEQMAQRSAEANVNANAPQAKVRKRDLWLKNELDAINQRIDRMDQRKELWELRDRMEDLEDRMSGLELEVRDVRQVASSGDNNPLADLSALTGRNLIIRFERNSTTLDPEYRVVLNEVFEQLARSPQDRVLITGYTDRSGDAAVNLRLSEERAKAVRNYLLQRGIAPERLLVNYYGDSRSTGRDPSERRVEVEWLR
ncbi:MAG: OmpA family protein [Flavobacteriales bacterium]|nr:OmpA family protein [Flavobacteriales bacterium]